MRSALALLTTAAVAIPCGACTRAEDPRAADSTETSNVSTTDSVRLDIQAPDTALAGDPVRVRATLRNVTDRAIDLYLTGRDVTLDVVVRDGAGDTVWRRLEGEVVPAILQLRPLAAGESLEVEAVWPQVDGSGRRVRPGSYEVVVHILAEGEPIRSRPVHVRVESR